MHLYIWSNFTINHEVDSYKITKLEIDFIAE